MTAKFPEPLCVILNVATPEFNVKYGVANRIPWEKDIGGEPTLMGLGWVTVIVHFPDAVTFIEYCPEFDRLITFVPLKEPIVFTSRSIYSPAEEYNWIAKLAPPLCVISKCASPLLRFTACIAESPDPENDWGAGSGVVWVV